LFAYWLYRGVTLRHTVQDNSEEIIASTRNSFGRNAITDLNFV